jgi:Cd2+/Zn2+-exporting ATPase
MKNESDHSSKRVSIKVEGMDCPDCALTIQKTIARMPHVKNVNLNFDVGMLEATIWEEMDKRDIEGEIRRLGYKVEKPEPFSFLKKNERILLTVASGALAVLGFIFSHLEVPAYSVIGIYVLSIAAGGYHIARKGFLSARSFTFDMNFLMSVAVIGAIIIGEWLEGASVVFLFSLAQLLESYSVDKARNAIKSLMNLTPPTTLVRRMDGEKIVLANEVDVGETIIVKPGERVALDGIVVKGYSHVNQSLITGEGMPQEKKEGDKVFAGSLNGEGILEIMTSAPSHNTALTRIITLVERAQEKRAPIASFIERFSRVYTPSVIGAAILCAIIPPIFLADWRTWFYRALVLLVISCPCALVISTPVTIISGLTKGARHGILVKGGLYLERIGSADVIALDKTGTLTHGHPSVTDIIPLSRYDTREILSLAASIEYGSEHPIGEAMARKAKEEGIATMEIEEFSTLPGLGVKALVSGRRVLLGNRKFLTFEGIPLSSFEEERALADEGKTVMVLTVEGIPAGLIAIADTLKEKSREVVEDLGFLGTEVIMLTGDNRRTAEAIGKVAGIKNVLSEVLPEDKAAVIEKMQSEGKTVAMVGDGINDAPALATADIGIAMGAYGSDIAIETSDIALMSDDLAGIPYIVGLSRHAMRVIKQNILFAVAIKAVFFFLAFAGIATLWSAVFADMGASLIVIANGLTLLRWRG